jgi:alkylated DNA repair dioxygenase AlkB
MNEDQPFVYIPDIMPTTDENGDVYSALLEEIRPALKIGTVTVYGKNHNENRMTAMYSEVDAVMKYSNRTVERSAPVKAGYIASYLRLVNDEDFKKILCEMEPRLIGCLPNFNAVFVNWYRPPSETNGKVDSLGLHSDDVSGMTSEVILSVTFCEAGGERLFSFHSKANEGRVVWERELENGSIVVMLKGCQRQYKHKVSDRKTHLDKSKVSGGRINLTFRALIVEY